MRHWEAGERSGMTQVSYQTIRLSQGKHRGPDHGACVMELASMLAGEPFSDRPRCVDPVIAGFLRTYNDGIDEQRRQDLYPLAAEAVGTRSVAGVQAERARLCLAWAQEHHEAHRHGPRRLLPRRPLVPDGRLGDDAAGTLAGRIAVKRASRRKAEGAHEAAVAFVRELIAVTPPEARRNTVSRDSDMDVRIHV
jgi:hypothetical protein